MATHPNTAANYDSAAEAYHGHVSNPEDSIFHAYYEKPAIRHELPDLTDLDVISIGCGSGLDARWLADNGSANVTGVDISEGLLTIARRDNPDITFYTMDMEQLGFPDESFDLAYSSLAIHYLDNWTPALQEARRVLKPGGQYVFSCGHPIDTAVEYEEKDGYKYALLGRRINQLSQERRTYGDYLVAKTNGTKPFEGTLATVDVTVYHQTISNMIKYITDSGFSIQRMIEPQPLEAMRDVNPTMYTQLTRVPVFMIWVLQK